MKERLFTALVFFFALTFAVFLESGESQTATAQSGPILLSASGSRANRPAAETNICGTITNAHWTLAGSPYVITCNSSFASRTLTIDPGVTVKFQPGTKLDVAGVLLAQGTLSNPITFTSNKTTPARGDWAGLALHAGSGGSVLRYVIVEYGTGISADNTSLRIEYANIRYNSSSGAYLNYAQATISHSTIYSNTASAGAGVNIRFGSTTLDSNQITWNSSGTRGGGIAGYAWQGSGFITVTNNLIEHNAVSSYGGGGILFDSINGLIADNTITDNSGGTGCGGGVNVGGASGPSAILRDNIILRNTANCGGGVGTDGYLTVIGNLISENSASTTAGGLAYDYPSSWHSASTTPFTCNTIANNTGPAPDGNGISTNVRSAFHRNNIYGNSGYQFKNLNAGNVDATSNYWGTTDPAQIASAIYDKSDNASSGTVSFDSFLNSRDPCPPSPTTSISHIEVTQVTQDELNSVPLIAGKPTFVRVYLDCGAPGCSDRATGVLEVSGPNVKTTLTPNNGPISIENPVGGWSNQRGNPAKTLDYNIPISFTTGLVSFKALVNNASLSQVIQFREAKPIRVIYVPIRYKGQTPDLSRIKENFRWALKVFPTANLTYVQGATIDWDKCLEDDWLVCPSEFPSTGSPKDAHVSSLFNLLTNSYRSVNAFVFGWLPEKTLGGGSSNPTWDNGAGKAAIGDDDPTLGARIFAHEIGHLLGRRHTNTVANIDDPNCVKNSDPKNIFYPGSQDEWKALVDLGSDWLTQVHYDTPRIDEYGLNGFGFGWIIQLPSSIPAPSNTYDYMSYCYADNNNGIWTSAWTYQHIFSDKLQVQNGGVSTRLANATQTYLVASGQVFTDTTAILDPIWTFDLTAEPANPPIGTQYCLEGQDALGAVQQSRCFDLNLDNNLTAESVSAQGFNIAVPYLSGLSRILLRQGTTELAARQVSANAPVVVLTSPNGGETWSGTGTYTVTWSASDADGDPLTYTVFYASDGANWLPVSSAITQTQIILNATELPGGTSAKIRVMATDGVNTATDESDSPFTVGRKTPEASILSPDGSGAILTGSSLMLNGSGYDMEDGTLGDSALNWNSNIDGYLGTGGNLLVNLSSGLHTITLTATDSDGNTATATTTVNVQTCRHLTLTPSPLAGGTITANLAPNCALAADQYATGTVVTLTVATAGGYVFAGWSGDATGSSSSVPIRMDTDRSVVGSFNLAPTPTSTPTNTPTRTATATATPTVTSTPTPSGSAMWINRIPASVPSPRRYHSLAYDSARQRSVLFGGDLPGVRVNDTWEWNGSIWIQGMPTMFPPARARAGLVYDTARGNTILFGGAAGGYGQGETPFGDMWSWNGTDWTQLTLATLPSARWGHAMTYDSARQVVVLYGGYGTNGILNDLWEWDGTAWTQKSSATVPEGRYLHAMAFDSARQVTVLFGGITAGTRGVADTWEWNGTNWTLRQPVSSPQGRAEHSMAYNSGRGVTVLLGDYYDDQWEWDGTNWTQHVLSPRPSSRGGAAIVFDSARSRAVFFGGWGAVASGGYGPLNDLWEWEGSNWLRRDNPNSPTVRYLHSQVYDSARGKTVLFGGITAPFWGSPTSETWEWNGVGWVQRMPASSPSARYLQGMTFDSNRGVTILYGGHADPNSPLGDTWEWNGTDWTRRVSAANPSPGIATLAFDAARGKTILFGPNATNETWQSDGADWTKLNPLNSPPARSGEGMVYDSARQVIVLFGGRSYQDTWEWDGANWLERHPANNPGSRESFGMVFDAKRGRTILFGGQDSNGYRDDTWEWDGANWAQVTGTPHPSARYGMGLSFDSTRGVLVLFGGLDASPRAMDDTWEYGGVGTTPTPTLTATPTSTSTRTVTPPATRTATPTPTSGVPTPTSTRMATPLPTLTPTPANPVWVTHGPEGGDIQALGIAPHFVSNLTLFAVPANNAIFRSTDAGISWTPVSPTIVQPLFIQPSPNYDVDQTVFVGASWYGVLRSTDRGQTWVNVNSEISDARAIAFSPNYASDATVFVAGIGGIYKSVDGGTTWAHLINSPAIRYVGLYLAPDYPSTPTIYAGGGGEPNGGIYQSTDDGQTWTPMHGTMAPYSVGEFVMSPDFRNDHLLMTISSGGVYRTTDDGATWTSVYNAEALTFAFSPNYAVDGTIFLGNSTGLFKSNDRGTTWTSVDDGQPGARISKIRFSPDYASDQTIFAASSVGVLRSTDRGGTWSFTNGGIYHQTWNRTIAVSPNYSSDRTVFDAGPGVWKSTNGGLNWQQASRGLPKPDIYAFTLSPNYASDQTAVLWVPGGGAYKTSDGAANWNAISVPNAVNLFAFSPTYASDRTIFIGTWGNGIHKTTDDAGSWFNVSTGITHNNVSRVVVSPNYTQDQTIFAIGTDNGSSGWLYRSVNGGQNWSEISVLNAADLAHLVISPNYATDHTVVAATTQTIYRSTDGGNTWSVLSTGV